jgi:glutamate-5-semialdehyde dehydrogenase
MLAASTSANELPGDALEAAMRKLGRAARAAALCLATADRQSKDNALALMAAAVRRGSGDILAANLLDMNEARAKGLSRPLLDRLMLDASRIEAMAKGLEAIAGLGDPVGRLLAEWTRPNGLRIARVSVPLGVIGIIYESRPNVTADAGGLCLKSGNAVILRGGSESARSSGAIVAALRSGLAQAGLPEDAIQLVPTQDRRAVSLLLAMKDEIDVIVPRGGRGLIERVAAESRIPVIMHLEGLCHTYVDGSADPAKARAIVLNAKMRRTGICGATETLLVDRRAPHLLKPLVQDLLAAGCEVRGDGQVQAVDPRVVAAKPEDWDTEYLDAIISVALVDGVAGAIEHIRAHGSKHTEAIVTEDLATAERFMREIDAGIVIWNASTQFADGGEFGMGAEIGISTGKLHARGPVGVEQLTSYKYMVKGDGQTRP